MAQRGQRDVSPFFGESFRLDDHESARRFDRNGIPGASLRVLRTEDEKLERELQQAKLDAARWKQELESARHELQERAQQNQMALAEEKARSQREYQQRVLDEKRHTEAEKLQIQRELAETKRRADEDKIQFQRQLAEAKNRAEQEKRELDRYKADQTAEAKRRADELKLAEQNEKRRGDIPADDAKRIQAILFELTNTVDQWSVSDAKELEAMHDAPLNMETNLTALELANQLKTEIRQTALSLQTVFENTSKSINVLFPNQRPTGTKLMDTIVQGSQRIAEELAATRATLQNDVLTKRARDEFKRHNPSLRETIRLLPGYYANDETIREHILMWIARATEAEEHRLVFRSALLAIQAYLQTISMTDRSLVELTRNISVPQAKPMTELDRLNGLAKPPAAYIASTPQQQSNPYAFYTPEVKTKIEQLPTGAKGKSDTKMEEVSIEDRVRERTGQLVAMMQQRVNQRNKYAATLDTRMMGSGNERLNEDLVQIRNYVEDRALQLSEAMFSDNVGNYSQVILTVVSTIIDAVQPGNFESSLSRDRVVASIRRVVDPLITKFTKFSADLDKSMENVKKSLQSIASFWNEYTPWNIIDTLTAQWTDVLTLCQDEATATNDANKLLDVLEAYTDAIDRELNEYRVKTMSSAGGLSEDILPNPVVPAPQRELHVETAYGKMRKKYNKWHREFDAKAKWTQNLRGLIEKLFEASRPLLLVSVDPRVDSDTSLRTESLEGQLKEFTANLQDSGKLMEKLQSQLNKIQKELDAVPDAKEDEKYLAIDANGTPMADAESKLGRIATSVTALQQLRKTITVRFNTWKRYIDDITLTSRIDQLTSSHTGVQPFLQAAEDLLADSLAAYLNRRINAGVIKKLKDTGKNKAGKENQKNNLGPDAGLPNPGPGFMLALSDHDSKAGRIKALLYFAKLVAGAAPVPADSIVDMSVILTGHSEMKEQASFLQLSTEHASNENAAMLMLQALTDVKQKESDDSFLTYFGESKEDEKARQDRVDEEKQRTARLERMGQSISEFVDTVRQAVEHVETFEQALLVLFTPYGAQAVLTSWHFLQHNCPMYGKRSLAQMICCASLDLRAIFARLCGNQYNTIDKRRPTRHAHGIDFATELAIEHSALVKFLTKKVRLRPTVRTFDDMSGDPWIIDANRYG